MIKREICKFLIDFWDLSDKCCVAINHIWNQLTFSLQDTVKLTRRNARRKNTKKIDWDKERHRKTANTRKKKSLSHSFFNKYKRTLSIVYNSMRKYILRLHRKRKCCHWKRKFYQFWHQAMITSRKHFCWARLSRLKCQKLKILLQSFHQIKLLLQRCAPLEQERKQKNILLWQGVYPLQNNWVFIFSPLFPFIMSPTYSASCIATYQRSLRTSKLFCRTTLLMFK